MKKIWVDCSREMNREYVFSAQLSSKGDVFLRIAASNAYQIYVNGKFFAFGPLRSAHGFSLETEYKIEEKGLINIVVLVVEYGINSYCFVDENGFFACEVIEDGKTILNSNDFKAQLFTERVQKVERLCLQRNFTENYKIDDDFNNIIQGKSLRDYLKTKEVDGNNILNSSLTNPDYKRIVIDDVIESGSVYKIKDGEYFKYHAPSSCTINDVCKGYDYPELTERFTDEICSLGYNVDNKNLKNLNQRYILYDSHINRTGFIYVDLDVEKEGDFYLSYDEILYDEISQNEEYGQFYKGKEKPLIFHRLDIVNAVKYHLKKGIYHLVTFEPYTFRYIKVISTSGNIKLNNIGIILYENPDSYNIQFNSEDEKINKIFLAAQNTFAQNSVDVLTDCPSRERAGWLCDSFFSGRAEKLLTGENKVEKNFLNNYLIMPQIKAIPKEIFPMCYPSDHLNGRYIPNWSMWLVIELYDYLTRTGDKVFVDKFKFKVFRMIDFFINKFLNEDGLLENLESWVFIEWSKANYFIDGVNYPSNMLFYATMKCADILYGVDKYEKIAAKMKNSILKNSFNGEFFEDNALRKNGKLERTGNISETCQYYAFFFKVADKETHKALYKNMFETNNWGAKRDQEKLYPNVWKSNAFIGNFLRLELIRLKGDYKKVIDESIDYLYYQSERTGTLWEYMGATASCNHGFTSYVANLLFEALTGYSHVENDTPIFKDIQSTLNCEITFNIYEKKYKVSIKNGNRIVSRLKN